jgi:hypothetical protein
LVLILYLCTTSLIPKQKGNKLRTDSLTTKKMALELRTITGDDIPTFEGKNCTGWA